jgi:CDP-diacylglycerol--glycerol-3-phosphate 3-phosphatidyltransferase
MVVVIVCRELAVTGLRGIASSSGVVVPAQELGKYKMIFQMFALEALLLHYRYPIPGTGSTIDFHAGGMVLLWVRSSSRCGRRSTTTCACCGSSALRLGPAPAC